MEWINHEKEQLFKIQNIGISSKERLIFFLYIHLMKKTNKQPNKQNKTKTK